MSSLFPPLQLLLMLFAGWVNRSQQEAIDYLNEENRILKDRLGGRRIRFTDAERCRLATTAKTLGRKALRELDTLVTPDTLLRWHRELIARKWDYSQRHGPGRPRLKQALATLVLRMARDNPSWGYSRIMGALANLGHTVSRGSIANILAAHGIDPAPERGKHTSWSTFLNAHWEVLAASDFFSVEVWTSKGLVTHYVLFVIELATRSVRIAGITTHPDTPRRKSPWGTPWMMQQARQLTDGIDGCLAGKRYLIVDRETKYCAAFRGLLEREGITVLRLPPRSPNLNAYAERFVRSIKEECLNRMIFFGESSLRRAINEYVAHYHLERNHRGMENRLLDATPLPPLSRRAVRRRERLGGMLNYYYREAA